METLIKSNNLYSIYQDQLTIAGATFNYPVIKPSVKGGHIDILSKYKWKNDGSVDEVPYVTLSEYTLNYGIWTSNVLRLLNNLNVAKGAGVAGTDPYGTLYLGQATKFTYAFPFLVKPGNSVMGGGVNNTWNEINPIANMFGAIPFLGGAAKQGWESVENSFNSIGNGLGQGAATGFGAEKVFNFSDTKRRRITISFPLYNTIDITSAIDNFNFVNLFALQNVKTRTSWLTYIPPKLYTVDSFSMGGIYMPVAYVANFDVFSIGTTRRIKDYSSNSDTVAAGQDGILIPEAYKVEITLEELIPQSSNIMVGTLGGQKTYVIKDMNKDNPETINANNPVASFNLPQTLNANANGFGTGLNPYSPNGVSFNYSQNIPTQTLYPLTIIPPNLK